MKNKKLLVPVVLPALAIMIYFIITGIGTMDKYAGTPGDWHFIAASIGVLGFLLLMVLLGIKIARQRSTPGSTDVPNSIDEK